MCCYISLQLEKNILNMMDFVILDFILLLALFLVPFVIIVLTRLLSSSTTTNLPPGPPRWPVVGNLFQLGKLPHRDMARFCDEYGPLVYLRLGSVHAITTNDPEIISELLVKQDEVFASRPKTVAFLTLIYGCNDIAFASLGPKWRYMKRIGMEHLLTTKRLESFLESRAVEAQNLVHDVWLMSERGEDVNLRGLLGFFTMNNMTKMLLGKRYFGVGSTGREEYLEFRKVIHDFFYLLGKFYYGDYLPFWRWFDPYSHEKKLRDVAKRVDDFHSKIIEEHRHKRGENKGQQFDGEIMDFVDVLLSLPGENGKEHLDDLEIKALMQDMLFAGTDTSSLTIEWAMVEVIKHPSILKKIQEELDTVVGHDRMVSETDLVQLNYLRCVFQETFRMHNIAPFLVPHESTRATTINGYNIPAKTRVFINTYALGRNTKIWDKDVNEFRPERHFPENVRSTIENNRGADLKILPFGSGRRKCPGGSLGVTLVLLGLARLCHSFDWSPPHGTTHQDIDTLESFAINMTLVKPLIAVAKPRLPVHLYQQ